MHGGRYKKNPHDNSIYQRSTKLLCMTKLLTSFHLKMWYTGLWKVTSKRTHSLKVSETHVLPVELHVINPVIMKQDGVFSLSTLKSFIYYLFNHIFFVSVNVYIKWFQRPNNENYKCSFNIIYSLVISPVHANKYEYVPRCSWVPRTLTTTSLMTFIFYPSRLTDTLEITLN